MIQLTHDQIKTAFYGVLQGNMWPYEPPAKRPVLVDENFLQGLLRNINLLIQQAEENAARNAESERAKE